MSLELRFPLDWHDDWERTNATNLDGGDRILLMRIMQVCWQVPRCSMPNDPAWIARKLGVERVEYESEAALVVARFFRRNRRGRLVNDELGGQYLKARRLIDGRDSADDHGLDSGIPA